MDKRDELAGWGGMVRPRKGMVRCMQPTHVTFVRMDGHRKLKVWQDARLLVLEIYAVTRTLPRDERFVTVPQLRRAAWSVGNNIAEGNARRGRPQLSQFLNCALGSLGEIDAMMSVLPDLYTVPPARIAAIDSLRIRITRGIFRMMRASGR